MQVFLYISIYTIKMKNALVTNECNSTFMLYILKSGMEGSSPPLFLVPHWQTMKHEPYIVLLGSFSNSKPPVLPSRMEHFISLYCSRFCQVVNKMLIICVLSHQIRSFPVFSFSGHLKLRTATYSWTSKLQNGSNYSFNSTLALTIVSGPNSFAAAALCTFTSLHLLTALLLSDCLFFIFPLLLCFVV